MLEEGRKEEEEEKRKSRRKVYNVIASGVDHGNRCSIAKDSLTTADCKSRVRVYSCCVGLRCVALGEVYVCIGKSRDSKRLEGVLLDAFISALRVSHVHLCSSGKRTR